MPSGSLKTRSAMHMEVWVAANDFEATSSPGSPGGPLAVFS